MNPLKIAAALAIIGLTACKDETPPHWQNVCLETEFSHFITTFTYIGKVMVPIQTPIYRCVKMERRCLAGSDFEGDIKCAAEKGGDP